MEGNSMANVSRIDISSKNGRISQLTLNLGGIAALLIVFLFMFGLIGIITTIFGINQTSNWFSELQNNWLVVLFKVNIISSGIHADRLSKVNMLDITIMALMGIMFIGLYITLRTRKNIWAIIATLLPFAGIIVFLLTATAGRSSLMIAGIIISIVILVSTQHSKVFALLGILAGILLFFAGDLGTTIYPGNPIVASCIVIGYSLWIIWFVWIAKKLLTNSINR
jgi:hypothetical protein